MRGAFRACSALVVAVVAGGVLAAQPPATTLRFEITLPAGVDSAAVDGRAFVIVSNSPRTEPRLSIDSPPETEPFFALNVESLRPGQRVTVDDRTEGYPIERLHALPAGDYSVQALLNVYETVRRADGHVVKMHMDQWEGQHFEISPGNRYSSPQQVHIDPRRGQRINLTLDRIVPAITPPQDTEYVRHLKFQSPSLSAFWGRPIFIGATVLVPRDYDSNTGVSYPVLYEQGHFSTGAPGGFGESLVVPLDADESARAAAQRRQAFTDAWTSDEFPRILYATFQHPTPYYDASYGIDSPNVGPYGHAIVDELIPYVESHFRAIREPRARILYGGSTGGWEALALQIFHPDFFGSTYAACPDPVDFHAFQIVNIYEWPNAWFRRTGWIEVPLPSWRTVDGIVTLTMEQELKFERTRGDRGRSGGQWDAWQAAYGPLGDDGYFKPLFDPRTGAIDASVAAYWRTHTDLTEYLRTHWSEVGPRLAGKLHISVGDMDTYYLNNAVHLMEDFLATTKSPPWGGTVVYGPRQPHCWAGPLTLSERVKVMAQEAARAAARQ